MQRGLLYQDNLLGYDSNGRLARNDALADRVSVLMEYDAAGNLVHQQNAEQSHGSGTLLQQVEIDGVVRTVARGLAASDGKVQDLWYAYDSMNRQVMIEGAANGNAVDGNNVTEAQGHLVTYDENGNRISETYQGKQLVAQVGADGVTRFVVHQGRITMYYRYDAAGRLTETAVGAIDAQGNALGASYATVVAQNYYDAAGRLVQSGASGTLPSGYAQAAAANQDAAYDTSLSVNYYDANGRLQRERITDLSGVLMRDTNYAGGYDAAGNVVSYLITDGTGNVSTTQVGLTRLDGYKRTGAVTTKVAPNGVAVSTSSSYTYDRNGDLVRTDSTSAVGAVTSREQHNDLAGYVLQTKDGDIVVNRLVVSGRTYAVWQGQEAVAVAPMMARTMFRAALMEATSVSATGGVRDDYVAQVEGLYWALLGRAPDASGLDFWVGAMMNNGLTIDDVANEIMASSEYGYVQTVNGIYWELLGRDPSRGELAGWVAALDSGTTEAQIRAAIMETDEYKNPGGGSGGGGTDPGPDYAYLVSELYQTLLGRSPSSDDVAYWTDALKGGMSLSEAAELLKSSPEYANRQSTTPDTANFDDSGNAIVRRNAGDTLQSLAQKAYGDSRLWYVIAEANGVTFNADLSTLKTIVIPDAPAPEPAPTTNWFLPTGSSSGSAGGTWSADGMRPIVAIPTLGIPNVDGAAVRYGGPQVSAGSRPGTPAASLVVQFNPGDTVETLALKAYGDVRYARVIASQNNLALDADLSKLNAISIPSLNVLTQAGNRAESYLRQLEAEGRSGQANGTLNGPQRASVSQGAQDYANEVTWDNIDANAANQVRSYAHDEGRNAAAMYLLSHPDATDGQLYEQYIRTFDWEYEGGMSQLANQAGTEYDPGDRMADIAAMASGSFARNSYGGESRVVDTITGPKFTNLGDITNGHGLENDFMLNDPRANSAFPDANSTSTGSWKSDRGVSDTSGVVGTASGDIVPDEDQESSRLSRLSNKPVKIPMIALPSSSPYREINPTPGDMSSLFSMPLGDFINFRNNVGQDDWYKTSEPSNSNSIVETIAGWFGSDTGRDTGNTDEGSTFSQDVANRIAANPLAKAMHDANQIDPNIPTVHIVGKKLTNDDSGISFNDVVSFAADMTPGVGTLKSLYQLGSEVDPFTGEPVDQLEEGIGLALGLVPFGKILTRTGVVGKLVNKIDAVDGTVGANSSGRALQFEEFVAPSTGKSIQAAVDGNAIVPVDKVSIYARGGVADVSQELRALQDLKQSSRKEFDADPGNAERLDQLKSMQHNYERSTAMARELDNVGLTNTPANNDILINHLLQIGQSVGPENRVWVPSLLEGPNGALQVKSTWKIMDDNRAYLNTLMFVPVK